MLTSATEMRLHYQYHIKVCFRPGGCTIMQLFRKLLIEAGL